MEEITTRREGTIDVVEVLGELDMSNVHALDEAIEAALSDHHQLPDRPFPAELP
jgi:hypothetical protein